MNPLRFQSICLAAVSMPFAVRGFIAAAWATALAALLCGGVVFALDWLTDNGIF